MIAIFIAMAHGLGGRAIGTTASRDPAVVGISLCSLDLLKGHFGGPLAALEFGHSSDVCENRVIQAALVCSSCHEDFSHRCDFNAWLAPAMFCTRPGPA
jgi:hypothetical protein